MVILLFGVLLIIYGIFAKKYSIAWGMLFVLLIMGFQEGIPGDFMSYKELYQQEQSGRGFLVYLIKETEYSYIWLVKLCSSLMNFNIFVFLTSLVQCFSMGMMIKDHADKRYWNFSILLVFFTYNIMLIQMKAMRQGYSVDCLLLAYCLLGRGRYFLSLLMAVVAYGFHNSSIIALPFYVAFFIVLFLQRKKLNMENATTGVVTVEKSSYGLATILAVGLLFFTVLKFTLIDDYIRPFVESLDFFEYESYMNEFEERGLAWLIILYVAVSTFFSGLYYKNEKSPYKKSIALLSVFAGYAYVAFFGLGSLFRVCMFFDIFSIVTFPNVAGMLRNSYGKDVALYYILFNMAYLMYFSIPHMVSMNINDGFGYGMFRFSFM